MVPAIRLISKISGKMDEFSVDSATDVGAIFEAGDILYNIHQCTKITSIMRRKTVWLVRFLEIQE